ncbi:uncharacterized protein LOC129406992 isoform X1 [Sorex araneus]|uniref:uncharacterized protein LOC129406992 isoform X1 n=1 Tax=Sorex araneus TaxID=42254 RepID=UPI002433D698|nr:uncharacterized protein LOC129406992 isoform X1 [Sorex araneus]
MILLLLLVLTRRGGCACVCVHGRLSFPSTSARIHKTPPLQRELQTCASVRRSVRPCACPPSPTLLPPETQSAIPAPLSAFQRSVRPAQTTHQRHSGLTLGSPLRDHSWNAQGTLWVLDIEPGSASCKESLLVALREAYRVLKTEPGSAMCKNTLTPDQNSSLQTLGFKFAEINLSQPSADNSPGQDRRTGIQFLPHLGTLAPSRSLLIITERILPHHHPHFQHS